MLLVFCPEDSSARVFDSVEDANRDLEGIDVENREYVFLDEHGTVLEPEFGAPVTKKILGLVPSVFPGPFSLRTSSKKRSDVVAKLAAGEVKFEKSRSSIRSLADLRRTAPALFAP